MFLANGDAWLIARKVHPKSASCSTSLTQIITPLYKLRGGLICIWHRQSSAISFSQFKMPMISRRSFATIMWPLSSSPPPTWPRLKPSSHLCWYPPTTRTFTTVKFWWLKQEQPPKATGKNVAAALGGTDRNAAISALKLAQGHRQP